MPSSNKREGTYTLIGARPDILPSLAGQLQSSIPFRELAQRPFPASRFRELADYIERADEVSHNGLTSSVTVALVLASMNKDLDMVQGLLALADGAGAVVPPIPEDITPAESPNSHIPHFNSDPFVAMAIARTALQARAPDADWLRQFAVGMAAHYRGRSKGPLHSMQSKMLIEAIICALVANDLALAKELATIRKSFSVSKYLFPFLKRLLRHAEVQQCEGRGVIRITDAALRLECIAVLDHFRRRVGVGYKIPGDANMYFGMIEGAYLWSWFCLQACAPEPVLQTDWEVLGDLLTG